VIARALDPESGVVVAERLRTAETHWARLRGLLGTRALEPGDGLWLLRSRQIHMIGMRYPIDVAFLDDELRVLRAISGLAPGRISPRVAGASSVLELPAGTLRRAGLAEGSRLEIEGQADAARRTGSALGAALANLGLAVLYVFFATAHFTYARRTGQWTTALPIVGLESMIVVLALVRRRSVATTARPLDWVIGLFGAFLPLLMRPTETRGGLAWLGQPVQAIGLVVTVAAVACLGRSFGLVAADRGIKTGGLYRLVRHPLYAGYLIGYVGYTAVFTSLHNLLITGGSIVALNARAVIEERFLKRDPAYRDYADHVPWRLVPWLY
jgi:protein-S-isoprenylcysteine O-methyltransferase Ste14/uncharacterized membrane protein (UPF0127 family)